MAPIERRLLTVCGAEALGGYRLLRVIDPGAPSPVAGQFAMLQAAERWGGGEDERPYLPRAFSFMRWRDGEAEFLLEDVGPGTKRLGELGPGDRLWVLGPLGRPFSIPAAEPDFGSSGATPARAAPVLVGGGAGIAPLVILREALAGAPAGAPTVLLGFRDAPHAAAAALIDGAQVATDDGSVGHRGRVTELLEAALAADRHARVYACGPEPMLEAVRALCAELAVPAELALEAPMACGFGACHGCVVPRRGGGYLRVCVDGPVIEAAQLAPLGAPARADSLAEAGR